MISGMRHILLDIEGTTCPVSFVSEVLFPYAQKQLQDYLARHGQEDAIQLLLQELKQCWQQEEDSEARALLEASLDLSGLQHDDSAERRSSSLTAQELLPYLHWLIQRDRKVTPWKELQGLIWRDGYARGDLQANLFNEVVPTLREWKQKGLELSVYSSGSVEAQKLLYGHSQDGDVRGLFSHWFDTRIGSKQDVDSYRRILTCLACRADQVLFISDAIAELQAASEAGMEVVFSDREGNPQRDPAGFNRITQLDQLAVHL